MTISNKAAKSLTTNRHCLIRSLTIILEVQKLRKQTSFSFLLQLAEKLNCLNIFQISSATDASNFDEYPPEADVPPEDETGWDADF